MEAGWAGHPRTQMKARMAGRKEGRREVTRESVGPITKVVADCW